MEGIIFDIDGVLANCSDRLRHIEGGIRDYDAFFSDEEIAKDTPIAEGIALYHKLRAKEDTPVIFLVTGRPERTRSATISWLEGCGIPRESFALIMRKDGDHRPANIVKRELVQSHGIQLAIDDDPKNCRMYAELGVVAMLFMSSASNLWEIIR